MYICVESQYGIKESVTVFLWRLYCTWCDIWFHIWLWNLSASIPFNPLTRQLRIALQLLRFVHLCTSYCPLGDHMFLWTSC